MKPNPKYYSEEIIKEIESMADKGVTDKEIAKSLNIGVTGVARRTTEYWRTKFNKK